MNQCTPEILEEFLADYGWNYYKVTKGIWTTGFATDIQTFPLKIILDDNFVTFSVQPLLKLDFDIIAFPEISAHILELNFHSHVVKLCIDDVGDIVLTYALLNQVFDFEQFSTALGVLGHYTVQFHKELDDLLPKEKKSLHL